MTFRCAYQLRGHDSQCDHPPEDARLVELPTGDMLVTLMCLLHCQVYDATLFAARQRRRQREELEKEPLGVLF